MSYGPDPDDVDAQYDLMTIEEILLGKDCSSDKNHDNSAGRSPTDTAEQQESPPSRNVTRNIYTSQKILEPVTSPLSPEQPGLASEQQKPSASDEENYLSPAGAQEPNVRRVGSAPSLNNSQSSREEKCRGDGKWCHFPGLIPLCRTYLEFIGVDSVTYGKLNTYLE